MNSIYYVPPRTVTTLDVSRVLQNLSIVGCVKIARNVIFMCSQVALRSSFSRYNYSLSIEMCHKSNRFSILT